jgi:hypothetical protein
MDRTWKCPTPDCNWQTRVEGAMCANGHHDKLVEVKPERSAAVIRAELETLGKTGNKLVEELDAAEEREAAAIDHVTETLLEQKEGSSQGGDDADDQGGETPAPGGEGQQPQ